MLKVLIGFFLALLLMWWLGICKASRQAELLQDLDGCTVQWVTRHNSFSVIKMECFYWDWVISWKINESLYVSKQGFVIKAGW